MSNEVLMTIKYQQRGAQSFEKITLSSPPWFSTSMTCGQRERMMLQPEAGHGGEARVRPFVATLQIKRKKLRIAFKENYL